MLLTNSEIPRTFPLQPEEKNGHSLLNDETRVMVSKLWRKKSFITPTNIFQYQ